MRNLHPSGRARAGSRAARACMVALVLSGSGCLMVGTPTPARNLDEGRFQVDFRQGATVLEFDGVTDPAKGPDRRRYTWSALELGVQYGVTERLELGARLGAASSQLASGLRAKLALHRSVSPEEGYDLSLAPGLSFASTNGDAAGPSISSGHLFIAEATLLLGLNLRGGHQVVLGAGLGDFDWGGGESSSSNVAGFGALAGFSWRVTPGLRLMPMVAGGYSPWARTRGGPPPRTLDGAAGLEVHAPPGQHLHPPRRRLKARRRAGPARLPPRLARKGAGGPVARTARRKPGTARSPGRAPPAYLRRLNFSIRSPRRARPSPCLRRYSR